MPPEHEVIVIFGAAVRPGGTASGAMQRRVAAALEYARGRDVMFLATGGLGRYPPAESHVMALLLRDGGVPDGAIVEDNVSRTTVESVLRCSAIIRTFPGVARVFACSDAYHLRRCRWLFRMCGIRAGGIAAADGRQANSRAKWLWFHLREFPALVKDTSIVLMSRCRVPKLRMTEKRRD